MISYKSDSTTGIMEITIKGDVTDADVQTVTEKLEREKRKVGRLYVMEFVKDIGRMEPSLYWEDVKRLIMHGEPGGRAAIVADSKWKTWFNELLRPFVGTNMRIFGPDQIEDARAWLKGERNAEKLLGVGTPIKTI